MNATTQAFVLWPIQTTWLNVSGQVWHWHHSEEALQMCQICIATTWIWSQWSSGSHDSLALSRVGSTDREPARSDPQQSTELFTWISLHHLTRNAVSCVRTLITADFVFRHGLLLLLIQIYQNLTKDAFLSWNLLFLCRPHMMWLSCFHTWKVGTNSNESLNAVIQRFSAQAESDNIAILMWVQSHSTSFLQSLEMKMHLIPTKVFFPLPWLNTSATIALAPTQTSKPQMLLRNKKAQ